MDDLLVAHTPSDKAPSPEDKAEKIHHILRRHWLTPDERRELENELLKLIRTTPRSTKVMA